MANEKNLIPNSERTPEELREQCRKGGIASGESRKLKKSFKEACIEAVNKGSRLDKVIEALLKQCEKGNTKAFEILRDTCGELLTKQLDITSNNIKIDFSDLDKEE